MNKLYSTKSLCPDCKKVVDASVFKKGKKVMMNKECPEHGTFISLVSSTTTGYKNINPNTKNNICKSDKKASIAILDINNACNVNCPVCINDTNGKAHFTYSSIKTRLDKYLKRYGKPEILQISGGEPTIHPDFFKIVDYVLSKKINLVMINTNGVRFADDDTFTANLSKRNVLVYLQFDGFLKSTYKKVRGTDLSETKIRAMNNLEKNNMRVFLATTVIKGVNEKEVGKIVKYSIKSKIVEGIDFHSVAYTGRCIKCDPLDRITMPDIIKSIDAQTDGIFKETDFLPMPTNDPRCCMFTYSFLKDDEVKVIPRLIDVKKYLPYFEKSIVHDPKQIVSDLVKGKLHLKEIHSDFKTVVGEKFNPLNYRKYKKNVFKIMVKPFMDPHNFDGSRIKNCNIHQIMDDGTGMSFCAYTSYGREKINNS